VWIIYINDGMASEQPLEEQAGAFADRNWQAPGYTPENETD